MRLNLAHGRIRRTAMIMTVIALSLLTVAPAAAAQYEKTTHFDNSDAWTYSECGFDVAVEQQASGIFATRMGTGRDAGAFFVRDQYEFREVHTRISNGVTVVLSGHGHFIETRATPISGSVFQFSSVHAETLLLAYADGTIIARDMGNVRESVLFDTLGDATPGGNFIEQISFRVNGPHAVGDVDWCAMFN